MDNEQGAAVAKLPASVLAEAALGIPNAIVEVRSNSGGYSLPLSVINFAAIAQSWGANITDIRIQISIAPADGDLDGRIQASAQQVGATKLGTAVSFTVTADGSGKTIELNNFGATYVERTVVVAVPLDPEHATVVLYDPATGKLSFVPAVFGKQVNGTTEVKFKRNGNSTYAVLSSFKTFGDINGHCAKADIELLASKWIVNGVTDANFAPNTNITRAEFAALLVRSLGLTPNAAAASFHDVHAGDWFAGGVGAAVTAKLVSGYEDNTFKPNDPITREQMAVMVSRALNAAGNPVDAKSTQHALLAKFTDRLSISGWARASIAESVQAGIIAGVATDRFAPAANASRAEAVVMLKRMLQAVQFIN